MKSLSKLDQVVNITFRLFRRLRATFRGCGYSIYFTNRMFCGEFGWVKFLVCFQYKINPSTQKNICCGRKWPKCHFEPTYSRVGLASGWGVRRFRNNICMFSNPTEFDIANTLVIFEFFCGFRFRDLCIRDGVCWQILEFFSWFFGFVHLCTRHGDCVCFLRCVFQAQFCPNGGVVILSHKAT